MPDVDPEWLDARRAELGEALYAQEFEASFTDAGGSFFDLNEIEFDEAPALPGDATRWLAALDPAWHRDSFGVALIGQSREHRDELLVGELAALAPHGKARSFEQRRAREDATLAAVWELIAPFEPWKIVTDQHNSAAIESYFARRGVQVEVVNLTSPIQTAAFTSLRARLVDGSLRCWRHPELIEDLRRVRARDNETIQLPRYGDSHCDLAAALALGCYELRESGAPPEVGAAIGGGSRGLMGRYARVRRVRVNDGRARFHTYNNSKGAVIKCPGRQRLTQPRTSHRSNTVSSRRW